MPTRRSTIALSRGEEGKSQTIPTFSRKGSTTSRSRSLNIPLDSSTRSRLPSVCRKSRTRSARSKERRRVAHANQSINCLLCRSSLLYLSCSWCLLEWPPSIGSTSTSGCATRSREKWTKPLNSTTGTLKLSKEPMDRLGLRATNQPARSQDSWVKISSRWRRSVRLRWSYQKSKANDRQFIYSNYYMSLHYGTIYV